jgi:hypothetical protein
MLILIEITRLNARLNGFMRKCGKKFTGNFGKLHIITHACKSMHFLTCMYIGVAKLFILTGQLFILFIFLFYSLFFICIFLLYKDS